MINLKKLRKINSLELKISDLEEKLKEDVYTKVLNDYDKIERYSILKKENKDLREKIKSLKEKIEELETRK